MKKKIALILAIIMIAGAFPVMGFAASRFSDASEPELSLDLDVLGLAGLIAGNPDGLYHPERVLTRAEFCKLAVMIMGNEKYVAQYKNSSIFPDVRASHWASGYIGVAAKAEGHFVQGLPDGSFGPEKEITYGESITVIMRLLGYSDSDCKAPWPQGYIDLAALCGLGIKGLKGSDTTTRSQAAKLFADLLSAKTKSDVPYYTKLGTPQAETELISVDAANGTAVLGTGTVRLKNPVPVYGLAGMSGIPVFDGKLLACFIPAGGSSSLAPASAAVIVATNGSAAGFDALSGNAKDYRIYKNGLLIEAKELKQYDVATYDADANAINVCDTRVTAYYEDVTPNVSSAKRISFLGRSWNVLSTAQDMLAAYKPGNIVTFLLTADGQIAGATQSSSLSNMLAYVSKSGELSLLCGEKLIETDTVLEVSAGGKYSGFGGHLVSIRSGSDSVITLSKLSSSSLGSLDFKAKTLGDAKLAANVMYFNEYGKTEAAAFESDKIDASYIRYCRRNASGEVDLIYVNNYDRPVLSFGRAELTKSYSYDFDGNAYEVPQLILNNGGASDGKAYPCAADAKDGVYATAELYRGGYRYFKELTKLGNATKSAWIGETAINCNGVTYSVDKNAGFYNKDTKKWMNRTAAMEYANGMTLYEADGTVYIIEVYA